MASKRDQLQAYQFLVQRAVSALVIRETDPEQPPFRRSTGALFASLAIGLLALACVGVYGLIVPGGNTSWRSQASVIVEKETGTRYVYLNNTLHPVTNYVSALLLLGDNKPTVQVSRNSLAGVPRGPLLGIPDAPDALPAPDRLVTGPWSLCSAPGSDITGADVRQSVLVAGVAPTGGAGLGDRALLVRLASTGDRYLIWHGYQHQITDVPSVGAGLGLTGEPWVTVDQAWLDVLPKGAPIGPVALTGAGQPSTAVPGRTDIRVGAMLAVGSPGGGRQYFLAEQNALLPITALQYEIERAYPPVLAAYPDGRPTTIPLEPSSAAAANQLDPPATPADAAPQKRPDVVGVPNGPATACATFDNGASTPRLTVDPTLPPAQPLSETAGRSAAGTPLADRVYVPPGQAALVEAMPSPNAPSGTLSVVTDLGRSYPLASADVLKILGYASAHPVRLPAGLVARVPEGSSLDPQAATKQPPAAG